MHKSHVCYSKINSIAVVLVCLTFLHDYLLALKVIDSVKIAFYTSCAYFILITFQLSRDYAVQSINTELLNKQFLRLNKELDQKVQTVRVISPCSMRNSRSRWGWIRWQVPIIALP